jgi:hypothetical protein
MMKLSLQFRFYWAVLGLSVLALLVVAATPHADAAVTLRYFTATTFDDEAYVDVQWSTATEVNTASFNVQRSLSGTGPWTTVHNEEAYGSSFVGDDYEWPDEDVITGTIYYYQLIEVETNQNTHQVGDIVSVLVGVAETPVPASPSTSTRTPTSTPTPTFTPTATPTPLPTADGSSIRLPTDTPVPTATTSPAQSPVRVVEQDEETITPVSTAAANSSRSAMSLPVSTSNVVQRPGAMPSPTALPDAAGVPKVTPSPQQPTPDNRAMGAGPPTPEAGVSNPIPAASANSASIVPMDPLVIATSEPTSSTSTPDPSTDVVVGLLSLAAVLFVGGGLILVRHSRQ